MARHRLVKFLRRQSHLQYLPLLIAALPALGPLMIEAIRVVLNFLFQMLLIVLVQSLYFFVQNGFRWHCRYHLINDQTKRGFGNKVKPFGYDPREVVIFLP